MVKVICIDGSVNGITEDKEYDIVQVFVREHLYCRIKDDYGVYSEYRLKRFKELD